MRWVKIPPPVQVADGRISFRDLLEQAWLSDPLFGASVVNLRAAVRIETAFRTESDVVVLDEADWTLLCQVAQAPKAGYNPVAMRHALLLVDALLEAPDKAPDPAPAKHVRKPAA